MSDNANFFSWWKFRKIPVHESDKVPCLVFRKTSNHELEIRSNVSKIRQFRSSYGDVHFASLVFDCYRRKSGRFGIFGFCIGEVVNDGISLFLEVFEEFGRFLRLELPYMFESRINAEDLEFFCFGKRRFRNVGFPWEHVRRWLRVDHGRAVFRINARVFRRIVRGDPVRYRPTVDTPYRIRVLLGNSSAHRHFRRDTRLVEFSARRDVKEFRSIPGNGSAIEIREVSPETFRRVFLQEFPEFLLVFRQVLIRSGFDVPDIRERERIEYHSGDLKPSGFNNFRTPYEIDVREISEIPIGGDLLSVLRRLRRFRGGYLFRSVQRRLTFSSSHYGNPVRSVRKCELHERDAIRCLLPFFRHVAFVERPRNLSVHSNGIHHFGTDEIPLKRGRNLRSTE